MSEPRRPYELPWYVIQLDETAHGLAVRVDHYLRNIVEDDGMRWVCQGGVAVSPSGQFMQALIREKCK